MTASEATVGTSGASMGGKTAALVDASTFIGPYAYRFIPHPDPDALLHVMDRERIARAWVGHLPSVLYRDPSHGNTQLATALARHRDRLRPAVTIRPDWPRWEDQIGAARDMGAAAVRVYPPQWQLAPYDTRLADLALACGEARLPIILTVRFEDLRQRHPLDTAGDVNAATIRHIARAGAGVRLVVTAAGKDLIEETHWSLTPEEQARIVWDISWVWGPPEDHLAKLLRTIGGGRFVFGTQWPLRLAQNPRANIDLLPPELAGVAFADPETLFA
jgi:predicted TIM-barrel fold metal-dependent hydrolase